MNSANHWGGSLEINGGDSTTEDERSRNMDWDRASISHQQYQHNLDETQQSWLLGPPEKKKKKYVDLGCVVCSRTALKWTFWGFIAAFVVIALPIIIAKTVPKHKNRQPPPDNYTAALHKALPLFSAASICSPPLLWEKGQYKNPTNYNGWKRPPIEEVVSKLTTHFSKVHSRQCTDEAELAEHVVGLTCSLASCQFRKRLTRLSVDANGSLIPKDCVDKNLIKKSTWLKALVAIPKVQPRFAISIWKKYPTMKSLLSVYMDPNKSVHEKEFLLEDLTIEGLFGDDRRLGNICSKRVYRILMAQCGNIKTDDIESGADFFSHQS